MNLIRQRFSIAALSLMSALLSLSAWADGGVTRVFYPDQQNAHFTVDVPSDWTLMAQGEAGAEEYFEVEGPNGLELSFRTISGKDIDAAVETHVAYLKENFRDVKPGEAAETTINGMPALVLPAQGADEDGSVRTLGAGWFEISDGVIGELWYNVGHDDVATQKAADAVLNSLKKK